METALGLPALGRRARGGTDNAADSVDSADGVGTPTHCPYCSLQCGMHLTRPTSGPGVEVTAWPEFPTNRGGLCRKGWTAPALLTHRERLTSPFLRDRATGALRAATWEEALDYVAERVDSLRSTYGPDAVGVFGGGGLTNEKAYALGKFARMALRTSQIDYNGRWCMSSAASAAQRAFGLDRGLPFPLADIATTDVLVLVGSNLAETAPPASRHLDELWQRGGTLVVIDPRRTATADKAHLHLQPVPGTDLALANGLLHLLIARKAVRRDYVASRTVGFEDVEKVVAGDWPELVERVTGVAASQLTALADLLASARSSIILTARGAEQHAHGTETVLAWINVALALGQPGRPAGGWGCLTGQGNGQGGREHGQKADQLPGYRRLDDPAARAHVAGVWGIDPDDLPGPGRSAYEMLDTLGEPDGVRGLLVFGSNIVVSAPNATRVGARLDALDLLVVADMVMSETAARADVVLPVTQWAEEDGTMTNLEGRVIRRRAALSAPEGVRTDLDVLAGLAERLGVGHAFPTDPSAVFDELARASAGGPADYAGMSYDRLEGVHGLFWPCPDPAHPGTARLFADSFAHPDGKARFHAVTHPRPAEETCPDFPYHLTTGRLLAHYQSGAQTRRIPALDAAEPELRVQIHPALAARLGVAERDLVRVATRRGSLDAPVRLSSAIRRDTIFVPMHWVGTNRLTLDTLDPLSRMPEFKVCAATISPLGRPA